MNQKINANVSITIPDEYVLILKSELENLTFKKNPEASIIERKDLEEVVKDVLKNQMKTLIPIRYMNQKQVCIYTNTSPGTVNKWVKEGLLKQIIFEEGSYPKYDVKDVDALMENFKIGGWAF